MFCWVCVWLFAFVIVLFGFVFVFFEYVLFWYVIVCAVVFMCVWDACWVLSQWCVCVCVEMRFEMYDTFVLFCVFVVVLFLFGCCCCCCCCCWMYCFWFCAFVDFGVCVCMCVRLICFWDCIIFDLVVYVIWINLRNYMFLIIFDNLHLYCFGYVLFMLVVLGVLLGLCLVVCIVDFIFGVCVCFF